MRRDEREHLARAGRRWRSRGRRRAGPSARRAPVPPTRCSSCPAPRRPRRAFCLRRHSDQIGGAAAGVMKGSRYGAARAAERTKWATGRAVTDGQGTDRPATIGPMSRAPDSPKPRRSGEGSGAAKATRAAKSGRAPAAAQRVDEFSAGGLVVDLAGDIPLGALIGRTDRQGRLLWSLPKGHIEAGETRRAGRGPRGRGGDRHRRRDPRRARHDRLLVRRRGPPDPQDGAALPACGAVGGELSDADIEVAEVAWVPLPEIRDQLAYPDERGLVDTAGTAARGERVRFEVRTLARRALRAVAPWRPCCARRHRCAGADRQRPRPQPRPTRASGHRRRHDADDAGATHRRRGRLDDRPVADQHDRRCALRRRASTSIATTRSPSRRQLEQLIAASRRRAPTAEQPLARCQPVAARRAARRARHRRGHLPHDHQQPSTTAGICLCQPAGGGVYPLYFTRHRRDRAGGDQSGRLRRRPTSRRSTTSPKPVQVSWVWPLLDRPHRLSTDTVFTDDDLAESVRPRRTPGPRAGSRRAGRRRGAR